MLVRAAERARVEFSAGFSASVLLSASLVLFFGCGSGALRFSGTERPPLVAPAQVTSGDRAPPRHQHVGKVTAGCTPLDRDDAIDGTRLSDLSCSPQLLLAALRDGAARAGGVFLKAPRCTGVPPSPGRSISCSAEVWRPENPEHYAAQPLPAALGWDPQGPAAPGAPAQNALQEAWRVRVDYWPEAESRPSVDPSEVNEVVYLGAGKVPLGELSARCEGTCARLSMTIALQVAAARVGANQLVDVRCTRNERGTSCLASGAAPEVAEAPLTEAH
jgi:hypothetical protein